MTKRLLNRDLPLLLATMLATCGCSAHFTIETNNLELIYEDRRAVYMGEWSPDGKRLHALGD